MIRSYRLFMITIKCIFAICAIIRMPGKDLGFVEIPWENHTNLVEYKCIDSK